MALHLAFTLMWPFMAFRGGRQTEESSLSGFLASCFELLKHRCQAPVVGGRRSTRVDSSHTELVCGVGVPQTRAVGRCTVCVYVCMHVYICVHSYGQVVKRIFRTKHTRTHSHPYMHVHTHTHTPTPAQAHAPANTRAHTHTHTIAAKMARTSFAHKSKDSIMFFICLSHIWQVMVIRRISQQLSFCGGVVSISASSDLRSTCHFQRQSQLHVTVPEDLSRDFGPRLATGPINRVSPCPSSISPLSCGDAHFNTQHDG